MTEPTKGLRRTSTKQPQFYADLITKATSDTTAVSQP